VRGIPAGVFPVAFLAAIALAGCDAGSGGRGGKDPSSPESTSSVSQPGNAPVSSCAELARKVDSVHRLRGKPGSLLTAATDAGTPQPGSYHRFVGSRVLLIGNSHTWLSQPARRYSRYDVDAVCGRGSEQAYEALDRYLRRRHRKVVFDIATNDCPEPVELRKNLRRAWARIGKGKLVLVSAWRIVGASCAPVNRILRRFHRSHPRRTALVPWARYAKRKPGIFLDDGVHFTAEGYRERARMVKGTTRRL
jgi:hypothetical protein